MNPPLSDPLSSTDAGVRILPRVLSLLRAHPRLAIFPLLAAAAGVVLFVFFASAFAAPADDIPRVLRWEAFFDLRTNAVHLPAIAAFYVLAMFVATFCNVALYHETIRAFAGHRPSVVGGVAFACRRIVPIVAWSLFAGSVGIILRILGEKLGWLGRIVTTIAGFGWSVAAAFAVPVIVRDGLADPIEVLRRSGTLVRNTWGGLVYGFVALTLVPVFITVALLIIVLLVLPGLGIGLALHESHGLEVSLVITMAVVLLLSVASQLVRDIYHCALYVYASEGVVPDPFSREDMDAAWKTKG